MELESAHEGVLSKVFVQAGTTGLTSDTVLAMLGGAADVAEATPVVEPPSVPAPAPPGSQPEPGGRLFASPRARRLAGEAGIDLSRLRGSGPRGRIIERDIDAAKARDAAPPIPAAQGRVLSVTGGMGSEGTYVDRPHDGMRKAIARRLTESKQTIPHFYLSVDCELDAMLALKDELNAVVAGSAPTYRLTVNDFIIKAWALALMRVPEANVSWTQTSLRQYSQVDVAVAVAIPGGLITPVVRAAEAKTLPVLSNEMKVLASRAQERKLKPDEYEGGTTSVSNLGMLGVRHFAAILSPPQATLLAVGTGEKRMVVKDDQPAIATMMSCTLSVDHRALDGAAAAALLASFKAHVEQPLYLLI
jgi:pyruvate dehydrogenase E2 component (dihydrolipoamide acetyltransferase)